MFFLYRGFVVPVIFFSLMAEGDLLVPISNIQAEVSLMVYIDDFVERRPYLKILQGSFTKI